MTDAPRILIIDDELSTNDAFRQEFCETLALREAHRQFPPNSKPLADTTFCSGQRKDRDGWVENDLAKAIDAIQKGWPFEEGGRWALVCLDLNFTVGKTVRENQLFGFEILEKIQSSPELAGLPVVMLSTWERDVVERRALEFGVSARLPILQKWGAADKQDSAETMRHEFSKLLFLRGLVEDGNLRTASLTGQVNLVARSRPIAGSSLPLLEVLRKCRQGVASPGPFNVLVEREPGDDGDALGHYINDHKVAAAAASFFAGSWSGKVVNCDNATANFKKEGTLTWSGLDSAGAAELTQLREALSGDGARQCVVYSIQSATDDHGRPRFEAPLNLEPLTWPPLRDRGRDIERQFRAELEQQLTLQASKSTILDSALQAVHKHDWPRNHAELKRVAIEVVRNAAFQPSIRADDVLKVIAKSDPRDLGGVVRDFDDLLREMKQFKFQRHEINRAWPRLLEAFAAVATALFKEGALATAKPNSLNASAFAKAIDFLPQDRGDQQRTGDTQRELRAWRKRFGLTDPIVGQLIAGRKADPRKKASLQSAAE